MSKLLVVWFHHNEMTDAEKQDLAKVIKRDNKDEVEIEIINFSRKLESEPGEAVKQILSYRNAVVKSGDQHIIAGIFSGSVAALMVKMSANYCFTRNPELAIGANVLSPLQDADGNHSRWDVIVFG